MLIYVCVCIIYIYLSAKENTKFPININNP